MVTMADVAREAGVSTATVSHVLNDTRRVRANTRELVLAAIARTGYTHNTIARSLATASTRSIALAMSASSNPYFGQVLNAVEVEAAAAGYILLVSDPHEDPERELWVVGSLHQRRVDGIILAPSPNPRPALDYLAQRRVPVLLIDRFVDAELDQVGPENVEATAALVDHLAGIGHRRIGMIAGRAGLSTSTERVNGYVRGLDRNGLPHDPHLVADGASDETAARQGVARILALANPPTALVVGNNAMTIGVVRALHEAGRSVPGDMALVVYDDFPWADVFSPRLTAMAQPSGRIGSLAVRMLLERLADPSLPPRTVRLEPTLVHRDSCGCTSP